jgi:hypothetical protein
MGHAMVMVDLHALSDLDGLKWRQKWREAVYGDNMAILAGRSVWRVAILAGNRRWGGTK